ncbi:hypothetical protein [Egicoccus sp. AB-alg6-2]|uniref:hypothetical protein n=1 Tax=Egicoccus sp. AB-alg6-2 TaxID=3242692 RepID=UPI00359E3A5A
MPFLDPKKQDDEDDALPGAPGLHLDLDVRVCPDCRRQARPWESRCPDCDTATVAPQELPADRFVLPDLGDEEE